MKILNKLKFKASYSRFILVYTVLMYVVSNAINIDKIAKWFVIGGSIDYTALIAYLIFGLGMFVFIFVILAHRWTLKPLSILFVILSAAVTYFISKYNVAIDTSMVMNTVYTDPTEVGALLSVQMIPYAIFLIIIPVYLILRTEIVFDKPMKHIFSALKIGALSLVVGAAFLYLQFNSINRAGNISQKYIVHSLVPVNYIRSIASVIAKAVKPVYAEAKAEVKYSASLTDSQDLVVVLVVGETSRQKSFSLYGYERKNTNPVLSAYQDLHILNGKARLGSTLYALPEILEKKGVKLTAITDKAGINTSCYVNFTLYDNCAAVGEVKVENCGHGGTCYDEDVIPLLENNLKSYTSGGRLVVLHLGGGSHGPLYTDRFPEEFQQFKPMCFDADVVNQCTKEELYNSFDNSILYVDYVVGKVISKLDQSGLPYVMIYLSDHGESLLEDGRIFHGMPPGMALPPEQAEIPLIVKSSIPVTIAEREEYTQQDVFDTVLDLLSVKVDLFDNQGRFITK